MKYKIAYVVSDLKRVGPSNQTLNIIKYSNFKKDSIVITLFQETDDTMINEYLDNDIKIECLNLNRITFMLSGKKKLFDKLKEYSIQIVHSYGVKPDCLCDKVCRKNNIRHIITLRNYPKEDILTRMNFIKGRIALHNHLKALLNCQNIICCSKSICNMMKKDYPSHSFTYVQNGVDIGKYNRVSPEEKEELRKKYFIDRNKIIYISTGSFIKRKRIEETINGFIKANVENSVLLLLGDGPLFNELKDKYSSDNVVFVGKTNNVKEYLQLSDMFISSSESEGLPNSVLEAIACGLPVILSNIPQHEEILEELKNVGKCYQLGNIDELSGLLLKSSKLKNNESIENSVFTMENMSKKYCDVYDKLLKV